MARYMGAIHKKSRRLGFSILENNKDLKVVETKGKKRVTARKKKLSTYGQQLQEKQKLRFMYGLNERQLRNTFLKAKKMKGVTGLNLLILLESRLDNIVYRLGYATTRRAARQLVSHGHVFVDNNRVDIPSFRVKIGEQIKLSASALKNEKVATSLKSNFSTLSFVKLDQKTFTGAFIEEPLRKDLNADINEALVVEWYNRFV